MRLELDQPAPDFGFDDLDGQHHRLSSFEDEVIWLTFQRDIACPLGRLRMYDLLRAWWRELAGKLRVVVVLPSERVRIEAVSEVSQSPLTVAADPDNWIGRLYGIESSLLGFLDHRVRRDLERARSLGFEVPPPAAKITQLPCDFLIDPTGKIRLARYGAHWSDHLLVDDVVRFLNPLGLQRFEVGPRDLRRENGS